jgi:hypothetical protein
MNSQRIIFSQIMDFFPQHHFNICVRRYHGNYRTHSFSCHDQFLCMAFAQLTFKESLRDIITCLRAVRPKLYHAGIRGNISKSTLADANEKRPWRIYADFAQLLIHRARQLYAGESFGVELQHTAYALDSTTIDLCLSLFPWAQFRRHKSAVKIHTLMDLKDSIPCFVSITGGAVHDVNVLDDIVIEPGAFYIMDRAYIDFARLFNFTQSLAFFGDTCQVQPRFHAHQLSPRGQINGPSLRPKHSFERAADLEGLSCRTSANKFLRRRKQQETDFPDQQFHSGCFDNRDALQVPMADRTVFSMV